MTRKPVQAATTKVFGLPVLIVIADDGTMWATSLNGDNSVQQWTPLRDLPQDKDA